MNTQQHIRLETLYDKATSAGDFDKSKLSPIEWDQYKILADCAMQEREDDARRSEGAAFLSDYAMDGWSVGASDVHGRL